MAHRTDRLGSEIKKCLSDIIRNKVKDPRIDGMTSITSVEVTGDLKYAKAYVSVLNDETRTSSIAALNHSAGFIRSELAQELNNIRTVPKLTFLPDTSAQYGAKIQSILQEIKADNDAD